MAATPRLNLPLPADGDPGWGPSIRAALATLDDQAGRTFVQPTQPTVPGPYLWVQTGLNGGSDWTLWIEDGT